VGQAGGVWSAAHQPAMRRSDAGVIAGKPSIDERLAETCQPVGHGLSTSSRLCRVCVSTSCPSTTELGGKNYGQCGKASVVLNDR